jgi:hypothetical protein
VLTSNGYVQAKYVRVGDQIVTLSNGLSDDQWQIMLGLTLSDGGFGVKKWSMGTIPSKFMFMQSSVHADWFDWCVSNLKNLPEKARTVIRRAQAELCKLIAVQMVCWTRCMLPHMQTEKSALHAKC